MNTMRAARAHRYGGTEPTWTDSFDGSGREWSAVIPAHEASGVVAQHGAHVDVVFDTVGSDTQTRSWDLRSWDLPHPGGVLPASSRRPTPTPTPARPMLHAGCSSSSNRTAAHSTPPAS